MTVNTCSILLVNDDPQVIASLHEALTGVRHRLIVGPTAAAAVTAMNGEEEGCAFDALLVDLDNGTDGLALMSAVHSCCPQLPVIALTPLDECLLKEEAFLRGASALVDKPVVADEVTAAVHHACGCAGRRPPRRALLDARRILTSPRAMRR
jgi:CheY-like chemotaxis protein